jgi:hypothetical protein
MMAEATKKAAKKTAPPKAKSEASAGQSAAPAGEKCQVAKCKQPVRAKGYCRKHYLGWRRGKVGDKHRYSTCSKPECRKPAIAGGRCAEHAKGAKPAAEAAPAA